MIHNIHQSDQEKQKLATDKTTEAVNVLRETTEQVALDKAKSSDIKEVVRAINSIPEAMDITPNLKEVSNKLDEAKGEHKNLMTSLIEEVKNGAFPITNLDDIENVVIGTDMTETNKLLVALLNKEAPKIPEYPAFPEFPEPIQPDFTQTNKLLQKLIDLESKDEEISINATLNIK